MSSNSCNLSDIPKSSIMGLNHFQTYYLTVNAQFFTLLQNLHDSLLMIQHKTYQTGFAPVNPYGFALPHITTPTQMGNEIAALIPSNISFLFFSGIFTNTYPIINLLISSNKITFGNSSLLITFFSSEGKTYKFPLS